MRTLCFTAIALALALPCISAERNTNMDEFAVGPVADGRFTEIRHLDMTCSFHAPPTRKAWEERAGYLREQILTGTGLLPMPEKTPLNARIFGRIERDGYSVEKVYFESYPGFYVTGNLYRPRSKQGPFPAVLNPHGHWEQGRIGTSELRSVPGRCISFARQGYVAFTYDMVGYNDSTQVEHRAGDLDGQRAYLWGVSIGGLQLWNSIRAVDFLLSLPDVDDGRIACTGASGGGTQTFLLTAVDDRVKCAAPVNMISSTMQGGCQCENPPLIRVDTNNIEIGALAAPRPLMLVSATGDWTAKTPEVEYPAIRNVYKLFDVEEKVGCVQMEADHNYNKDSREAVYAWFGRWMLGNPNAEDFREQPFHPEAKDDLLVFARDPRPENALTPEEFIESRIAASEKQMAAMKPHDADSLRAFREAYGSALRHALSVESPEPSEVAAEDRGSLDMGSVSVRKLVIGRGNKGDAIPALLFTADRRQVAGYSLQQNHDGSPSSTTLVVHGAGKSALIDGNQPGPLVRELLRRGQKVLAIDAFNTGEHRGLPESAGRMSRYEYFTTYNRMDTAERVQDILTALAWLRGRKDVSEANLVGEAEGGLWCLLSRAFAPDVERTIVDADGFDSDDDQAFIERLYVPCLRRAGDFRTAAALIAPGKLFIHNTRGRFGIDWFESVYAARDASSALSFRGTRAEGDALADWITK